MGGLLAGESAFALRALYAYGGWDSVCVGGQEEQESVKGQLTRTAQHT